CSKHMTGDRSQLLNFVKKFIGTVRFRNDHFGAIMGYGDYVVSESVISRFGDGILGVMFCLTEFCLKEVNSVKVGSKGHYLGSSPHTMTDVKAPSVRSNDQCLPRIRWVQTGYLKFSAKGTKREVFGMPIPGSLITADLREVSYYQEYLENVVKHR
nr:integrase, catalytic region, zinc finger, CCHC-type, peptidase aspartic, catalytic [Tanacetum cinerariifolium]